MEQINIGDNLNGLTLSFKVNDMSFPSTKPNVMVMATIFIQSDNDYYIRYGKSLGTGWYIGLYKLIDGVFQAQVTHDVTDGNFELKMPDDFGSVFSIKEDAPLYGHCEISHTKVYCFCENMCKEETMTKEQIEDLVESSKERVKTTFSFKDSSDSLTINGKGIKTQNGVINLRFSMTLSGDVNSIILTSAGVIPEEFRPDSDINVSFYKNANINIFFNIKSNGQIVGLVKYSGSSSETFNVNTTFINE